MPEPINHADRLSWLGGEFVGQRHLARKARDKLAEAVRAAVRDGMSESEAARLTGVSRLTVRSWVGK